VQTGPPRRAAEQRTACRAAGGAVRVRSRSDASRASKARFCRLRRKNGFKEIVRRCVAAIDSRSSPHSLSRPSAPSAFLHCVSMPSLSNSSDGTRGDAQHSWRRTSGCEFREIAIEPIIEQFIGALAPSFADVAPSSPMKNLQARAARRAPDVLSEQVSGWLLVANGNKSEMSGRLFDALSGTWPAASRILKDVTRPTSFRFGALSERASRPRALSRSRRSSVRERRAPRRPGLDEDSRAVRRIASRTACSIAYFEDDRTLDEPVVSYASNKAGRRTRRSLCRRLACVLPSAPCAARRALGLKSFCPQHYSRLSLTSVSSSELTSTTTPNTQNTPHQNKKAGTKKNKQQTHSKTLQFLIRDGPSVSRHRNVIVTIMSRNRVVRTIADRFRHGAPWHRYGV